MLDKVGPDWAAHNGQLFHAPIRIGMAMRCFGSFTTGSETLRAAFIWCKDTKYFELQTAVCFRMRKFQRTFLTKYPSDYANKSHKCIKLLTKFSGASVG